MDAGGSAHAGHMHMMWFCDGEPLMTEGGSWIGHVFPGCLFVIWSLHWLQGTLRSYFGSEQRGEEYRSQTFYTLPGLPRLTEPFIKTVLPLLAISLELYFAHKGGWRTLVCPADSFRPGHFQGAHIGNWAHASMYIGFIASGAVELFGHDAKLPTGTSQAFLTLGFLNAALLMGLHAKHTPLDKAIHAMLFLAMISTSVMCLLESIWPTSMLASIGRVAAVCGQGAWFWIAARMLFEGRPAWNEAGGADLAPAMMVPVLFAAMHVCIFGAIFTVFVLWRICMRVGRMRSRGRMGHQPVPSAENWQDLDSQHAELDALPQALEMNGLLHGDDGGGVHAGKRHSAQGHGHASGSGMSDGISVSASGLQWHAAARARAGSGGSPALGVLDGGSGLDATSAVDCAGGLLPLSGMPSSPKTGLRAGGK